MRSRYLKALVFAVALSLLFVSCDSFFNTNLFKSAGLGQVSAAKLQGETSAELVDDAYDANGDPSTAFFDALAGDSSVKAEVLATLEATYTSPSASPAAIQEAASLAAQIEIVTTGGDGLVNNLAAHYEDFLSVSTIEGAVDLVQSLVPDGLASDPTAFKAAIDALLSANDAFVALGDSILAPDGFVGDLNIGTAAQSALAAAALTAIESDLPGTYTDTATYLWDLMQGTTTDYPASFSLDTAASTPLGGILSAAGLTIDPINL